MLAGSVTIDVTRLREKFLSALDEEILVPNNSALYKELSPWAQSDNFCVVVDQLSEIAAIRDPTKFIEKEHHLNYKISTLGRVTFNHATRLLLPLVTANRQNSSVTSVVNESIDMTDKQSYYVRGFIVHSSKKYQKLSNDLYLEAIESVVVDEVEVDEASQWTNLQSRGGLCHIAERFFTFLLLLENTAQQYLSSQFSNGLICNELVNMMTSSNEIGELFSSIFEGTSLEKLFHDILQKYCQTRCKAYVSRVRDILAEKRQMTSKASASLRQQLATQL